MEALTEEQIFEAFEPFIQASGLNIISKEIFADEPPLDEFATVSYLIDLQGQAQKVAFEAMASIAGGFNKAHRSDIRAGFYSAAIGYDDIPEGQAKLDFDDLPFVLSRSATPKF